jgi:large subunit ribosomal protein L35
MKIKHKTKKAVAKRFRLTKKGKLKYMKANRGHLLSSKSRKRKRQLRRGGVVSDADHKRIAVCLLK